MDGANGLMGWARCGWGADAVKGKGGLTAAEHVGWGEVWWIWSW